MKKLGVILLFLAIVLLVSLEAVGRGTSVFDNTFEFVGTTKAIDGESSQITIYRETVSDVLYVAQWQNSGTSLTIMVDPDSVYRPLTWTRYQELAQKNRK